MKLLNKYLLVERYITTESESGIYLGEVKSFMGRVKKVGSKVKDFKEGDEVVFNSYSFDEVDGMTLVHEDFVNIGFRTNK